MEQQNEATLEVRPGFARRAADFPELVSQAQAFEADPELTKDAIFRAMAFGLADRISDKEYRFLSIAVSMLNRKSLEQGRPHCYIGGFLFRKLLGGVSERTLSRIKRNLEGMGLIIRHYDKRNRPQEKAGIDLRPLLFRLEEFQDCAEQAFESGRVYFAERQELDAHNYDDKNVMVGCQKSHANSPSPNVNTYTVQTNAESQPTAATTKSLEDQPQPDPTGKIPSAAISNEVSARNQDCSPKETSGFWQGRGQVGKGLSSKARSKLLEAYRFSPKLSNYLDAADIEKGDLKRVYAACIEVIQAHFNPQRNSDKTFKWAVGKFGWRAVLILICALEDPSVRSPEKWFGWAATKMAKNADLSDNLRRIANHLDAPETLPDGEDEISGPPSRNDAGNHAKLLEEPDMNSELMARVIAFLVDKEILKPDEVKAWIAPLSIAELSPGLATVAAPSRLLVDWASENYITHLKTAFSALTGRRTNVRIKLLTTRRQH